MHIVAVDTRLSGPQDAVFEAQRNAFIEAVAEQLEFQLGSAEIGLPSVVDSVMVASRSGQPELVSMRLLNGSSLRALLDQPVVTGGAEEDLQLSDSWSFARDAIIAAGRLSSSSRRSVEKHRLLVIAPKTACHDQSVVQASLIQAIDGVLQFGFMHVTCIFIDIQSCAGAVQPCFDFAHPNLQTSIIPNTDALVLTTVRSWVMDCVGSIPMTLTLPPACGLKASVRLQALPQVLSRLPLANATARAPKDRSRSQRTPAGGILGTVEQWKEHFLPSGLQAPRVLHAVPASSLDLSVLTGLSFVVRTAEVANDLRSWRLNQTLFGSLCETLHSSGFALLLQTGADVKQFWLLIPPKLPTTRELLLVNAASREQALILTAPASAERYAAEDDEQAMVDNFMRESIANIETLVCYNPLDFRSLEPKAGNIHPHTLERGSWRHESVTHVSAERAGLQFRAV